MLSLAQQIIFDRYKEPRYAGVLDNPTYAVSGSNPSCGDELTLYLQVEDGIITQARHTTRGCAVCTASADMLMEKAEGISLEGLSGTTVEEVRELLDIPLSPIRLKCALLAWEAVTTIKTN